MKIARKNYLVPLNVLVKINFDGAIFKTENRGGIGVVIRDHIGAILASLA